MVMQLNQNSFTLVTINNNQNIALIAKFLTKGLPHGHYSSNDLSLIPRIHH